MSLTIVAYPGNYNVKKALVAAKFGNVDIQLDTNFQMGVTNKTPEFLAMNPCGKVPVMKTPEGPIFESNAIARYVARKADKGLLGSNDYEASVVDQWIEFYNHEVEAAAFSLLGHILGFSKQPTKEAFEVQSDRLKKALGSLETALSHSTHKFLVADRVTLADIILVLGANVVFTKAFGKGVRDQFPKVTKYVEAVIGEPQFHGIESINFLESCYQYAYGISGDVRENAERSRFRVVWRLCLGVSKDHLKIVFKDLSKGHPNKPRNKKRQKSY